MEIKINVISNIEEYKALARDPVKNREALDNFVFILHDGTKINAVDVDVPCL